MECNRPHGNARGRPSVRASVLRIPAALTLLARQLLADLSGALPHIPETLGADHRPNAQRIFRCSLLQGTRDELRPRPPASGVRAPGRARNAGEVQDADSLL